MFFPSDLSHPETGMKLKSIDIATINPSICLVQSITLGNHQPLKSRYMMKTSVWALMGIGFFLSISSSQAKKNTNVNGASLLSRRLRSSPITSLRVISQSSQQQVNLFALSGLLQQGWLSGRPAVRIGSLMVRPKRPKKCYSMRFTRFTT